MCWVLILAGLLIPVVLKKELAELKFVSVTLFVAIFMFIILNLCQLLFDSSFVKPEEYGPDLLDGIYKPTKNIELIESLSITMVAYSYQQNLFPIFEEL